MIPYLKLAGYIAAGIAVIWALWFAYDLLTASDKVKGRLGENQTDAAVESGQDAVNATGDQAAVEADRDKATKEMQDEVGKAENAGDAHAAGSDFLCDQFNICTEE